jgi:hypothetical protein
MQVVAIIIVSVYILWAYHESVFQKIILSTHLAGHLFGHLLVWCQYVQIISIHLVFLLGLRPAATNPCDTPLLPVMSRDSIIENHWVWESVVPRMWWHLSSVLLAVVYRWHQPLLFANLTDLPVCYLWVSPLVLASVLVEIDIRPWRNVHLHLVLLNQSWMSYKIIFIIYLI